VPYCRRFGVKSLQDVPFGDGHETNCRFLVANRVELCRIDTGPSATHDTGTERAQVPERRQDAAEVFEEASQAATESNEEIREDATEGDQEGEQAIETTP
jgi:hypothetical protein